MSELIIKTNNIPRPIYNWFELGKKNQEKVIKESTIDEKDLETMNFFIYKDWIYNLSDFIIVKSFPEWHGISNDTFFSGILIKLVNNNEDVIVGYYYS